ncbi:MAG: hypothetical protein ABSA93_09010 [Streptosporangiaceae bacterium]|jgi:hypothetical protein
MTDRAGAAAAELYGRDPDDFTARRGELVKAARAAGDPDAAKRIAALRKPTRPAWLLNSLIREHPEVPAQLAELSDGLRSAASSRDGARLRELSAARSALVDSLTELALASVTDSPAALREDVSATLSAAIADPEVAAELATGTLTRPVHWAGFGEFTPTGPVAPAVTPSAPKPPPTPLREAEDRNRRQQRIQEAERAVANAAVITASATAEEDRLESVVRDLEERVTAARDELAQARLRARRAEAAERKATTALERLRQSSE